MKKITSGTFLKPLGATFIKTGFSHLNGNYAVYKMENVEIHAGYAKHWDELYLQIWDDRDTKQMETPLFERWEEVKDNLDSVKEKVKEVIEGYQQKLKENNV